MIEKYDFRAYCSKNKEEYYFLFDKPLQLHERVWNPNNEEITKVHFFKFLCGGFIKNFVAFGLEIKGKAVLAPPRNSKIAFGREVNLLSIHFEHMWLIRQREKTHGESDKFVPKATLFENKRHKVYYYFFFNCVDIWDRFKHLFPEDKHHDVIDKMQRIFQHQLISLSLFSCFEFGDALPFFIFTEEEFNEILEKKFSPIEVEDWNDDAYNEFYQLFEKARDDFYFTEIGEKVLDMEASSSLFAAKGATVVPYKYIWFDYEKFFDTSRPFSLELGKESLIETEHLELEFEGREKTLTPLEKLIIQELTDHFSRKDK